MSSASSLLYFSEQPTDGSSLEITNCIGKGAYGSVHEAKLTTVETVAVKKMHEVLLEAASERREDIDHVLREFRKECEILQSIDHPNIVKFMGIYFDKATREPLLVMERMKENLRDFIKREESRLNTAKQLQICFQISAGLRYLHQHKPQIVHRDITDKNILINEKGEIKVADFGQAKYRPDKTAYLKTKAPGAIPFMPPEVLHEKPRYTDKMDVFSFGVLMLEIASLREPLPNLFGIGTTSEKIRRKGDLDHLKDDHPLKPLILKCLEDDPARRPNMTFVHFFLRSLVEGNSDVQTKHAQTIQAPAKKPIQLVSLPLPDLLTATAWATALFHDKKVFVCGGALNTVLQVFEFKSNSWKTLPSLPQLSSQATIVDGNLTLIGGLDSVTRKTTNKVSTLVDDQWQIVYPKLHSARLRPGVVHENEFLIVAGGKAKNGLTALDTIEILDVTKKNKKWLIFNNLKLPQPLMDINFACFNGSLFICGASIVDGITIKDSWRLPWKSIEQSLISGDFKGIDSQPILWQPIERVPYLHSYLLSYKTPVLIGGRESRTPDPTSDIHMYDQKGDKWEKIGDLEVSRVRTCAAMIGNSSFLVCGGYSDPNNCNGTLIKTAELVTIIP